MTTTETSGLSALAKAHVLTEALPWLQRFAGKVVVVKYGGNAMVDDTLKAASRRTWCSCGPAASTP